MNKLFPICLILFACSNTGTEQPVVYGSADVFSLPETTIKPNKDTAETKSDLTSLSEDTTKTTIYEEDVVKDKDVSFRTIDVNYPEPDVQKPSKDIGGIGPGPGTDIVKPDLGPKPDPCIDNDNDGYGVNCPMGVDCDDGNPNFAAVCPDCTTGSHPGCSCKAVAVNCYSGQQGWIGKGVCQAGIQLCKGGFWGGCNGETLPTPEVCDGKDNDCDGLIDEGVLSTCGTCDLSCVEQKMGPDYGSPFDPSKDSSNGVNLDKNGHVILDKQNSSIDLHHIWIAGTGSKVISKLNTKTGKEEGRYASCGSPSRTSVDLNGDVWVGCRSGGQVMKIVNKVAKCPDKNGNGKIETSNGSNALPYGQDECVRFIVKPDGGENTIRAAGVDKDNYVWVGGWNKKTLWRLHPDTGAVVNSISIGCNPYGLVIDQKGVIWVSGRGCGQLVRADPKTKQVSTHGNSKGSPYGINVDMFGNIWIANTNSYSSKYNPVTKQWVSINHGQRSRGVATSNDGHTYIALDSTSRIAKINVTTNTLIGHISLGGSRYPVGIAVDYDGYVWAVNQSKSSASKCDPKTMQVIGEYPVGKSPYTYSDMTGYTLNNYTAPKGHYTHTFGYGGWGGTVAESKTKTVWTLIDATLTIPAKAYVKIRYRTSDTFVGLKSAKWSSQLGPFPPQKFPIDLKNKNVVARYLQVEVFMQAGKDKLSPILKSLSAK